MITKELYKIIRPDGGTTVTPEMPTGMEYTLMYRLIADDGKILTNGETETCCVDVKAADVSKWTEIDAPEPEETE